MPNFDKTGPMGHGPLSGRGCGSCCGSSYGRGMGYGGRRRFFTAQEEKDLLKEEISALEKELDAARELLSKVEDQK